MTDLRLRLPAVRALSLAVLASWLLLGCGVIGLHPMFPPKASAGATTGSGADRKFETRFPAVDPAIQRALAPTGSLRVGVYPGSPSSMVTDPKTGERQGVSYRLGEAMAERLGVPVQYVEFERLALVLDGLKVGTVDFSFTNATPVRAQFVDFTDPLVELELGYLVSPTSPVQRLDDVDRPGVRVGVSQGSSSQSALPKLLKHATLQAADSLAAAKDLLRTGAVQAFATNKAILFEMQDGLPGYRVLDGRWGLENLAVGIPKGREVAMPWVKQFAADAQSSGLLRGIVQRAGLRGTT
jgi:polar amino acid transport system substrate-binding protein